MTRALWANTRLDNPSNRPDEELILVRDRWCVTGIVVALVLGIAIAGDVVADSSETEVATSTEYAEQPPYFVGSETCANCHESQAEDWRGSQHRHAMDHATEETVLGDFSGVTFDYFGQRSRFFRRDGAFLVETQGADGEPASFEVKYTFGLDPLQQYLIEFPNGRIQALSIAWDTRSPEDGGQRWFHLYPEEKIEHTDVLHWTKMSQNWNFMCAECHSTGLRKNYDAAEDRYATTYSEISVGCEACHGAGSHHVAWAQDHDSLAPNGDAGDLTMGLMVRFDERRDVAWTLDPETGSPRRNTEPAELRKEVETCGRCHARRSQISEEWVPGRWLSDTHFVIPLAPGLYHADGQMQDEVYNYGPFKQSRMFAAGVTCSDCHDPHGARLRAPGDGVCLQCHDQGKFASVSHRQHAALDPPLSCASCHMPVRTYMVVDPRHDHSFRIPRPDLSARVGTPDACTDCHKDKSPQWAAQAIEGWYGPTRSGFQSYAPAFHEAWSGQSNSADLLERVARDSATPAFVRASAMRELSAVDAQVVLYLARAGLKDADPMVRISALEMLEGVPVDQVWPLASPLLSDPIRGVRIRAASLLAQVRVSQLPAADRDRLDRAAAEFIAAHQLNADRPEGRTTLGSFFQRRGQSSDAEVEYKAALELDAGFAPAAANLADLYRQLGRTSDSEKVLRAALAVSPADPGLHHALGLTLIRLRRPDRAIVELRRAAELAPDVARYGYVYAVALHSSGRVRDAISVLEDNLNSHPRDRDTLTALFAFHRDAGDVARTLEYADRLAAAFPDDEELLDYLAQLRMVLEALE